MHFLKRFIEWKLQGLLSKCQFLLCRISKCAINRYEKRERPLSLAMLRFEKRRKWSEAPLASRSFVWRPRSEAVRGCGFIFLHGRGLDTVTRHFRLISLGVKVWHTKNLFISLNFENYQVSLDILWVWILARFVFDVFHQDWKTLIIDHLNFRALLVCWCKHPNFVKHKFKLSARKFKV